MINWRTNLGGALGACGTTLTGIGAITAINSTQFPTKWMNGMIIVGVIMSALGKFFGMLFAADAAVVSNVAKAVDKINQQGADCTAAPAISTK